MVHLPSLQVSFVLLVMFGLGCGYLGVLFSKLAVAVPNAVTMDDIGGAAMGKTGKRLVYAVRTIARPFVRPPI